jgi:hypothetical protein
MLVPVYDTLQSPVIVGIKQNTYSSPSIINPSYGDSRSYIPSISIEVKQKVCLISI